MRSNRSPSDSANSHSVFVKNNRSGSPSRFAVRRDLFGSRFRRCRRCVSKTLLDQHRETSRGDLPDGILSPGGQGKSDSLEPVLGEMIVGEKRFEIPADIGQDS